MKQQTVGDIKVSGFCLGCMPFGLRIDVADADVLLDRFREAGGYFFDSAHCYSFWGACNDGASERMLGDYIKRRGCRDEVVLATKGGHPGAGNYRKVEFYLSPGRVAADIDDSLARLHTDMIDLYWLHRDDPRVPVEEIVDMLNAEAQRGRIRAFGASNWTSRRLDAANRYAATRGIRGFVASQPRWSLIDYPAMTEEQRTLPETLLDLNAADFAWHSRDGLPVIPYGSTGNGFFATGGKSPAAFKSEANDARLQRATSLASELGVTPNQVALAWLLNQPFTVIPIVGTTNPAHLDDALGAGGLALTSGQVRWLADGEEIE